MKLLTILEEITGYKNATEFKSLSQNGLNFIKCKEGFVSKLKKDVKGMVIGYGTRVDPTKYANKTISKEQATIELNKHLISEVYKYIWKGVSVKINQQQFDALASLIYNVGGKTFLESNTRKAINGDKNFDLVTEWKGFNKSDGGVLEGLKNRRQEEVDIFTNKRTQFNLAGCTNV